MFNMEMAKKDAALPYLKALNTALVILRDQGCQCYAQDILDQLISELGVEELKKSMSRQK